MSFGLELLFERGAATDCEAQADTSNSMQAGTLCQVHTGKTSAHVVQ